MYVPDLILTYNMCRYVPDLVLTYNMCRYVPDLAGDDWKKGGLTATKQNVSAQYTGRPNEM